VSDAFEIINIGMNHRTAPVELRECLAAQEDHEERALRAIRDCDVIREGAYLSTCNRVEAILVTDRAREAERWMLSLMAELGGTPRDTIAPSIYIHKGLDAVEHVFRVAASLDSMVIGEPQILGQVKEAYARATRRRTSGVILNRLMHKAFHVAKRVRTETGICESAVSISYAAVELGRKIFHELEGKKVLLIGAGEMAEVAARHLITAGVDGMWVANRTFERAVEVAGYFQAEAVSLDEIPVVLEKADIVLSSTAATQYVITHDMTRNVLRKRRNRPLFFIDIAVPRDVEPRVNDLENVYVYDIDDLKDVVEYNREQRKAEAAAADRIIREEVLKFDRWLKTLAVVPTIRSLREKAEAIVRSEWKKSDAALAALSPEQREAVRVLTRSIVEKVLNDPILFLKGKAGRETLEGYLDVTRKLFNLDREE